MTEQTQATGAELVRQIREKAMEMGVPLMNFVRQLSPHPKTWLAQLMQAQRPKPHTVVRVHALLNGGAVPPPPPNSFQAPARRGEPPQRQTVTVRNTIAENEAPTPVVSDPCFHCGVRADVHFQFGCRQWLPRR